MVSTSRGVSRRLFSVFSMFLLVVPLISLQQPSNNVVQAEASNKGAEAKRAEETAIYVIYPQNFRDKSQADAINKLLDETVSDPTKIYASEVNGDGMWTLFWNAALTESQAAAIKADTNVSNESRSPFLLMTHLLVGWIHWEVKI